MTTMRQMIGGKFYIMIMLSIVSVFILGSCETVSGTAQTVNPAVVTERGDCSPNPLSMNHCPAEPGLSVAAYTTPLAFALRQAAIQKIRTAKSL